MKRKIQKRSFLNLPHHLDSAFAPSIFVLLSCLVLGGAFLWSGIYWLVFAGAMPLYLYFERYAADRTLRQTLLDFYMGGIVFSLMVLFWIAQADVGRWITIGGAYSLVMRLVSLVVTAMVFATGFLIVGLGVYWLRKRSLLLFITALPFIWAFSELFRSYLFALLTYGPGASLQPNWNFGALGLAAINSPLAFSARIVSLYGLTALVVLANAALYLMFTKRFRTAVALLAVVSLFGIVGYVVFSPSSSGKTLHLAAVHISDPDGSLSDPNSLTFKPNSYSIVIMPEYSEYFSNPANRSYTSRRFGVDSTLLTSQHDSQVPKHNQLVVYDTQQNVSQTYDKQFIIPGGETLPYASQLLFWLTGHSQVIKSFHDTQQISRGTHALPLLNLQGTTVGPSVCSSIANPFYGMWFRHQGAQLLTNSASLVFLAHAPTYHVQERYLLRYQAISSRLPVVHASRTGTSLILDANGHVLAVSSNNNGNQLLEAELKL